MSEDSRAGKPKRKVLVVVNPSESDDDRKEHSNRPNGTARMTNAGPRNPTHSNGSSSSSMQYKQSTSPQPAQPPTGQAVPSSQYQPHQPPSSPVSTNSPSTPPPTTPNLHAPSGSVELESPSIAVQSSEASLYTDRTHYDPQFPPASAPRRPSKGYLYTKPSGGRPINKLDGPRRPRTSPTSDPYGGPPSAADRVIFVTADSERYVTVDLTGMRTAAQIRELILSKLHIYNDEDANPYLIYQTEIGAYAIGDALTDDHLLALCRDQGDAKGTLKFLVTHPFAPVHEPPPPSQPMEYNTIPNNYSQVVKPLRTKPRHTSRSRNGSFSSASEKATPEMLNGYEADLDYPDREATAQSTRPPPSQLPSSPPKQAPLPPNSPRRPSLATQARSNSPEQPISPPATSDRVMNPRKDAHALPPIPMAAPPLSPNRPNFPSYDESPSGLTVLLDRRMHARSGSDAAADRDLASRTASEQYFEHTTRQLRSHNHPSLQQLRSQPSRDTLRTVHPRRTYDDEDPTQEIIMPGNARPADELERVSPTLSRNRRTGQNSYGQLPSSPYTVRSHITQNPLGRPQPAVPSAARSRAANLPINSNILAGWKAEEGGRKPPSSSSSSWQGTSRLAKTLTKSMDNLRLTSPSSTRRNQIPPTPQLPITVSRPGSNMRDTYSPNSSLAISGMPGMPKSYDTSPRFVRPLPVQGSPHGASSDAMQSSSSQYGSRGGYGSTLISPVRDPYPRPLSATGDSISPTRGYPSSRLQSPTVYGSNLDLGEYNRSPRTISPNRNYHSPGSVVPGPRPRPNHNSNHSDRSSEPTSGPETSNTPPLTPQSLQDERRYNEPSPPSSPSSATDVVGTSGSDMTLKQDGQKYLASIFKTSANGTFIAPQTQQPRPMRQLSPPPPLASLASSDAYGPDDDDDDSDEGDGTWIVPPEPARNAARPPLKVQIENPTSSRSGDMSTMERDARQEPPPRDAPPSSYRAPVAANPNLLRAPQLRPESTFIDPDSDNWAPRPPPENIYEELEKFFPKHDLDRPVIEATSGDTSPTNAEPTAALPPPVPVNEDKARIRAKKSIRIVAQEHRKKIDRTSKAADMISQKDNMMRKRSTKLWGSRLEEVTTLQGRNNSTISLPESPSGGPTTFKWVRGELIGKGTYGRVYLALNATTGEMIAVKQVELPQTASDKNDSRQHTVVQALKMESETLRDLDHPNIVQYLGFEETPANLSIFLEYVPGGSVGSCLHKHGKFADNVTRSFTAQILSGLEYLHSKGILHRDMKADNILVEMSGICKISDFGISKRTEDLHGGAFTAMQGTVFWMAPEVVNAQKKGYNFKVDIWSVGCVVLEMWAGMRPWMGEEMVAVMFKLYQSKQPPPVPEDIVLSEEADNFRRKCFAINPEERPSAAELRKHPYLTLPPGWIFTGFT